MYHLRFNGSHYDIGQKRGKIFNKLNISFPIKLDEFQRDFGCGSIVKLKEFFPEVCEEVRGITDAIGKDYDEFLSWLMCMGCCMYNLEQNIPKEEIRGCTAFAFTHKGKMYYGRDNDLPPYLQKGSKSELYRIKNGSKFIINTSSFVNGEEGMNEYGLVVAMTFVLTNLNEIKSGINSVFAVRYLLERCKSVKDALLSLKKLPIASNFNILLADGDTMAVAECSPLEINVREALPLNGGEKFICAVNHFTSKKMAKYDASNQNAMRSMERYNTVVDSFQNGEIVNPIEFCKEILSGKKGFMCQYEKSLNFKTIWSSIFDVDEKILFVTAGDPRFSKYERDERLAGMRL